MVDKKPLKKMPGVSQNVTVNGSVRTIKMGRPICPNSKVEMEKDGTGRWVPKQGPTDPNRQNCQKMGGAWWKVCEESGHNPYFRETVWFVTEETFDDETGEVIGEKRFRRTAQLPNFAQVAVAPHLNSGQGARRAVTNKGFKRMSELGYEEVCQYRNCQRPVSKDAMSAAYGNYCSREELALVAAAEQGILLHRPDARLNGDEMDKVQRAREKELAEAIAFTK